MEIEMTPALADQCYSALVKTIGTPDYEHLRWSFIYSLTELRVQVYNVNSNRLHSPRFCIQKGRPIVVCKDLEPTHENILLEANLAIREIWPVKPAKKITKVRIQAAQATQVIPVRKMDDFIPSPANLNV